MPPMLRGPIKIEHCIFCDALISESAYRLISNSPLSLSPRLRNAQERLNAAACPLPLECGLFAPAAFGCASKISAMSGVDQYKTRKGNTSGFFCIGGFLTPDTLAADAKR